MCSRMSPKLPVASVLSCIHVYRACGPVGAISEEIIFRICYNNFLNQNDVNNEAVKFQQLLLAFAFIFLVAV